MKTKFKSFVHKCKQFPPGIKKLYAEAKQAYELLKSSESKGKLLTRNEREFIRCSKKDVSKIALVFLSQFVPIFGYVAIYFAFTRPKLYLTSHFWTEEQKSSFAVEDYKHRHEFSVKFLKNIGAIGMGVELEAIENFEQAGNFSIENLDSQNLRLLGGAHNLFYGNKFLIQFAPLFVIKNSLIKRADEIFLDDNLLKTHLQLAQGVNLDSKLDLVNPQNVLNLVETLQLRGINAHGDANIPNARLEFLQWLNNESIEKLRALHRDSGNSKNTNIALSLLLLQISRMQSTVKVG